MYFVNILLNEPCFLLLTFCSLTLSTTSSLPAIKPQTTCWTVQKSVDFKMLYCFSQITLTLLFICVLCDITSLLWSVLANLDRDYRIYYSTEPSHFSHLVGLELPTLCMQDQHSTITLPLNYGPGDQYI